MCRSTGVATSSLRERSPPHRPPTVGSSRGRPARLRGFAGSACGAHGDERRLAQRMLTSGIRRRKPTARPDRSAARRRSPLRPAMIVLRGGRTHRADRLRPGGCGAAPRDRARLGAEPPCPRPAQVLRRMRREGFDAARLMKTMALRGVVGAWWVGPAVPDEAAPRPLDRRVRAPAPNMLRDVDFTRVATWLGVRHAPRPQSGSVPNCGLLRRRRLHAEDRQPHRPVGLALDASVQALHQPWPGPARPGPARRGAGPPLRQGPATSVHSRRRAPCGSRHRAFHGRRRGPSSMHLGGNGHRSLQGRSDPATRAMARPLGGGPRHARMGRSVRRPPLAGARRRRAVRRAAVHASREMRVSA
jgi:hypothetical protein